MCHSQLQVAESELELYTQRETAEQRKLEALQRSLGEAKQALADRTKWVIGLLFLSLSFSFRAFNPSVKYWIHIPLRIDLSFFCFTFDTEVKSTSCVCPAHQGHREDPGPPAWAGAAAELPAAHRGELRLLPSIKIHEPWNITRFVSFPKK